MATGKVKWFNNAKGYGFVRPDAGGDDLFVHYSYIQMDGYRSLKAGQPVEYELQQANKGYHAVNLKPADEQPSGKQDTEEQRIETRTTVATAASDSGSDLQPDTDAPPMAGTPAIES